jgi:hypothetical protein
MEETFSEVLGGACAPPRPFPSGAGLVNLTPHPVAVVRILEDDLDAEPEVVLELPPSGVVARCSEHARVEQELDLTAQAGRYLAVPVLRMRLGPVQGLPPPSDGTWFVVSRIVAEARPDRDDLLVPARMVRAPDGRVLGCAALSRLSAAAPSKPLTQMTDAEASAAGLITIKRAVP